MQGSGDDVAWTALARAEVRAWEQDPATGHERLRWACDAYRRSIDLLEPGFVQVMRSAFSRETPMPCLTVVLAAIARIGNTPIAQGCMVLCENVREDTATKEYGATALPGTPLEASKVDTRQLVWRVLLS